MRKAIPVFAIALLVLVGCSDESDISAPSSHTYAPDVQGLKAGGGGSPQMDCNDLVAPGGLEDYFAMAKINPENKDVDDFTYFASYTKPDGKPATLASYILRWKQKVDDKIYHYTLIDLIDASLADGALPDRPLTSWDITRYEDEYNYATENEVYYIGPPTCFTFPDGSFSVYSNYIDKTGMQRQFGMTLRITDDYVPTDPPDEGEG